MHHGSSIASFLRPQKGLSGYDIIFDTIQVYKILQACNKNTTEWALTFIAKRDDDKTTGGNGDDFTGNAQPSSNGCEVK